MKKGMSNKGRFKRVGLGILTLCLLTVVLEGFEPKGTHAGESAKTFTEEVKRRIKKLSPLLVDPVSRNEVGTVNAVLEKAASDASKEEKPLRFGIGVLDKNGFVIAAQYIMGRFKVEDFSTYHFVAKAFKRQKITQDRLFFQDRSEIYVVCTPLVSKKKLVGALVLGFDPLEVKEYGLTAQQFEALNFNK